MDNHGNSVANTTLTLQLKVQSSSPNGGQVDLSIYQLSTVE